MSKLVYCVCGHVTNGGAPPTQGDLVAVGVLSGNRNFEGRINPHTRANYLASPLLCIAYALAGTVNIDFDTEPLGKGLLIIRTVCNIVISRC